MCSIHWSILLVSNSPELRYFSNNEIEVKNEVERQFNILSRGCDEIINEVASRNK